MAAFAAIPREQIASRRIKGVQRMSAKKKRLMTTLPTGTPPYTSEERVLEQWANGPRSSDPSIAQRMVARSRKATREEEADRDPSG